MFEHATTTLERPTTADKPLAGQIALVTGGTTGIGRGIALSLAAAGADVVVNYITDPDVADTTRAELASRGVGALAVQADVSDEPQVEAMFERAIQAFGAIDIVVTNAGIQRDAAIDQMTLSDWRKVIDVNLTGQFLCARAGVRAFKRQGIRSVSRAAGKIVCVSSVHDTIPWAGHANYAASKGGVMMLMKTLAQELAAEHIRVNSICPGAIRTPINRSVWENADAYAGLRKLIPMRRMGEPEEIGEVVAFLVSDRADYITGLNLYVDGGMLLYPGFEAGG